MSRRTFYVVDSAKFVVPIKASSSESAKDVVMAIKEDNVPIAAICDGRDELKDYLNTDDKVVDDLITAGENYVKEIWKHKPVPITN